MSVGQYVCPVRRLGSRCPGENRVRRESGVPDITHRPLVSWQMAFAIGQKTSWFGGLIYAIRIGTDWYSRNRPTMGEPIGQRSMRLNQDKRCRGVSPGDVCARVNQGNLTLSPPTCQKPAMAERIGRCSTRHLRVNGRCQPGQPEQHPVRGT